MTLIGTEAPRGDPGILRMVEAAKHAAVTALQAWCSNGTAREMATWLSEVNTINPEALKDCLVRHAQYIGATKQDNAKFNSGKNARAHILLSLPCPGHGLASKQIDRDVWWTPAEERY